MRPTGQAGDWARRQLERGAKRQQSMEYVDNETAQDVARDILAMEARLRFYERWFGWTWRLRSALNRRRK